MSDFSESDAVDLVAEEILEALRVGAKPSLDDYIAKYPELEQELRDLFPSLLLMEQFGSPDISGGLPNGELTSSGHRKLGDYVIVREVGRGGMGIVYEAEQESLGRRVAIKVLSARFRFNERQIRRFDREARSVARLEHPGIVPVYGIGNDRGVPFYVMKLINGQGLDQVLAELVKYCAPDSNSVSFDKTNQELSGLTYAFVHGVPTSTDSGEPGPVNSGLSDEEHSVANTHRVTEGETVDVGQPTAFEQIENAKVFPQLSSSGTTSRRDYRYSVARIGSHVGRALHYAHEQGVLHRDIKPSNLMLDLLGQVWVTDFGLAKISHEEDITNDGEFIGTLRYTSPEQLRGWSDPRSDVYSLGITLYELLGFRPAFPETDRAKLLSRIAHDDPMSIRHLDAGIPRDLATIVQKAIAKEPSHRYQSAAAFAEDLERFLDDKPILARPTSVQQHIRLWARRKPAVAVLSSLLFFSLITALLVVARFWQQSEHDRLAAIQAADQRQQALVHAEQALAKAEATSETLVEMIYSADPNVTGTYSVHQWLLDYQKQLGASLGEYPRLEAKLRHAIGWVFHARSELLPAENNLVEALRLLDENGLSQSLEAARTRELLANVYRLKRDNDAASDQLMRVIEIRKKKLGADHPETLQSRVFWLASLREVTKQIMNSEEILDELDQVAAAVEDRLDDALCAAVFLHARFYAITAANHLGKYQLSERYCGERLQLQRKIHKGLPNHPAIVYTLQQRAEIRRLQEEFDSSVSILRDAQARTRQWFKGAGSPQEIDMIIEEAETHSAAGDFAAMEKCARHAWELSRQHLETDNPLAGDSARYLAEALVALGREDEAAIVRGEHPAN